MITYPIKEFCQKFSQTEAAKVLGVTQGAVSQAISANRKIFIEIEGDSCSWYEIKKKNRSSLGPGPAAA